MKNKVISLFLAATMVLSLCPATVRAQTVSEEFSAKVAEAAETEAVEGTADPTEEPVVTGNEDTAKNGYSTGSGSSGTSRSCRYRER